MSTTTVSPLRQRMIEDMSLRNLAPRSQEAYIRGCKKLAAFLRRSPHSATAEDIRFFQPQLAEQGVSICTRNRRMTGVPGRPPEPVILAVDNSPSSRPFQFFEPYGIPKNTRPMPNNHPAKSGGAVRQCGALLQGIASCGHCGRRLRTHYSGRNSAPGDDCGGEHLVNGRGSYCVNIGGVQIDEAVTRAFIAALEPIRLAATVAAAERLEANREATLKQWQVRGQPAD